MRLNPGIIRNNLAEKLEVDVPYIMLPVADDPRDPVKVGYAIDFLADKLNFKMHKNRQYSIRIKWLYTEKSRCGNTFGWG